MKTSARFLAVVVSLALIATACGRVSQTPTSDSSTSAATAVTMVDECRTTPSGPTTYRYADQPGVEPERNSLDIYMPTGCEPASVVVWVHGGGWRRGDRTAGFIERMAAWANSLGAALVAVNYRLSTESGYRTQRCTLGPVPREHQGRSESCG